MLSVRAFLRSAAPSPVSSSVRQEANSVASEAAADRAKMADQSAQSASKIGVVGAIKRPSAHALLWSRKEQNTEEADPTSKYNAGWNP
jgi:hypothetical protein